MIYASLKPVQQWHHPTVPAAYLALALASGILVADAADQLSGMVDRSLPPLAVLALALAWAVKEGYWAAADRPRRVLTAAAATGLEAYGEVRLLDAPHTESNYLLHEMGYRVARRHSRRLRRIVRGVGFILPLTATSLQWALPLPSPVRTSLAVLAATAALLGIFVERWLFFAEAKHTIMLYYGARAA
jgi:DMSO reductase anchor subunit